MRTRAKVGAALLGLLVLGAAVGIWLYFRIQTYSFAPERPEQAQLAKEHAECAALYFLLSYRSMEAGKQPNADQKSYQNALKAHGKIGLNFSPDKKLFQIQTETNMEKISNEILAASEKKSLVSYIQDKENYCFGLMNRTNDFYKDVALKRASQR